MFNNAINKIRSEKGQSVTEFALILPFILVLMMAPIDLARVIYTQMQLNSAATESLSQLDDTVDAANIYGKIMDSVRESYGDVLDSGKVAVDALKMEPAKKENYTYYVYSSDLAGNPFDKQFEARSSNFSYVRVQYRLSLELEPLTFVGKMLMGDRITVSSRDYSRNVYTGGYVP